MKSTKKDELKSDFVFFREKKEKKQRKTIAKNEKREKELMKSRISIMILSLTNHQLKIQYEEIVYVF